MARRYKRKANGQFAGGGGGGSTAKKGATAKPKAPTNSSNAAATKLAKKKKRAARRRKVLMFAAENPQLVVGAVGSTAMLALNGRAMLNDATRARKISNSQKFQNEMRAAVRGVTSTVGSKGLKATNPNRKGVYKI